MRELIDFIQDDERLREERKKAKKNKDKYIGMSSDAVGGRGFGGGYSDGGWRSNRNDHGDNWCKYFKELETEIVHKTQIH